MSGSPIHGEGDSQSQEEEDYIRICTLCSNPIHITSELPELVNCMQNLLGQFQRGIIKVSFVRFTMLF